MPTFTANNVPPSIIEYAIEASNQLTNKGVNVSPQTILAQFIAEGDTIRLGGVQGNFTSPTQALTVYVNTIAKMLGPGTYNTQQFVQGIQNTSKHPAYCSSQCGAFYTNPGSAAWQQATGNLINNATQLLSGSGFGNWLTNQWDQFINPRLLNGNQPNNSTPTQVGTNIQKEVSKATSGAFSWVNNALLYGVIVLLGSGLVITGLITLTTGKSPQQQVSDIKDNTQKVATAALL